MSLSILRFIFMFTTNTTVETCSLKLFVIPTNLRNVKNEQLKKRIHVLILYHSV